MSKVRDEKVQTPEFSGEESKWFEYKIKFLSYAKLVGLSPSIDDTETDTNKKELAKHKILMSVKGEALDVIREFTEELTVDKSPSQIWNKLEEHYEKQEKQRVMLLETKLSSMKMDPKESMETYLLKFENLKNKLKRVGEIVSEARLTGYVLEGITAPFFDSAKSAIRLQPTLSFQQVKSMLVTEYTEFERRQQAGQHANSLHNQQRGNNNNSKNNRGAEYIALSTCGKEAQYFNSLRRLLNINRDNPIVVHGDNSCCIQLAKDAVFHNRTKHIDVRYHHVRDLVERGEMQVKYINTTLNLVDGFTKGLTKDKHNEFASAVLGLK